MGTDIHVKAEARIGGRWRLVDLEVPSDRNYLSFAILANVRNGFGFAGIPAHDPVQPIADPRGLPDDLSAGCQDMLESGSWPFGDHSFSWVTLAEMQAYPPITVKRTGMVHRDNVPNDGGRPGDWYGGISGPSASEYVRYDWDEPVKDAAHTFEEIKRELGWFAEDHGLSPEDVRIVFGFDS